MDEDAEDKGLFKGAHDMFIDELNETFLYLKKINISDKSPSKEEFQELERRFHMLKGSSGFFGFKPIADIAAELEKFFKMKKLKKEERKHIETLAVELGKQISDLAK